MKDDLQNDISTAPKFRTLPSTKEVPFSAFTEKNTGKIIELLKKENPTEEGCAYNALKQEHLTKKSAWLIIQQRFLYFAIKGNHKKWVDFLLHEEKVSPFFVYPNEKQKKISSISISASLSDHSILEKLLKIYNYGVYDGNDSTLLFEYLKSSTFNTETANLIENILSKKYTKEKINKTVKEAFKCNHVSWFSGHFHKEKLDYYQSKGVFEESEVKNDEPYIAQILCQTSLQGIKDVDGVIEKASDFLNTIKKYDPNIFKTENKKSYNNYAFFHQLTKTIIEYGSQEENGLKKIADEDQIKIFNYLISFYNLLKENNEFNYQQLAPKNTPVFATLFKKVAQHEDLVEYLLAQPDKENKKENKKEKENFSKLKGFFFDVIGQYTAEEIGEWRSSEGKNLIYYMCESKRCTKIKTAIRLLDYINIQYGISPTASCCFEHVEMSKKNQKENQKTFIDPFILLLKKVNKIEVPQSDSCEKEESNLEAFTLLVDVFKKYNYFKSNFSNKQHPLELTVQLSLSSCPQENLLYVWGDSDKNENWVEVNRKKFIRILEETGLNETLIKSISGSIESNTNHSEEATDYKNFVRKQLLGYYYKTACQEKEKEKEKKNKPTRF